MRNLSSRRRRMSGGADESLVQGKNFAANMPGQMRQSGGGAVLHGAPVLGGDAMLLDGDLRGKALMGPLDASTAAIRGMQDGGRRRRGRGSRRNNASARRSRSRRGRNNASARRSRRGRNNASARRSRRGRNNAPARRGRNNASARRSRRGRNNASARRGRNNASARRGRNNASARRGRNNASARRSRRGRNNASARRNRRRRNNNMYGGDGEEEYLPEEEQYGGEGEEYEDAVTPLERRRNNMYGGAHSLLPTDYASVNQSPSLLSASAAARAGTAFSSDPFANGSGSA